MKKTFSGLLAMLVMACHSNNKGPVVAGIDAIHLKRGDIISCGPPGREFGAVSFENSCAPAAKKDFELAIALLHSFEYDEAEKMFANVIDADPQAAIAYWGIAMSNVHPLWAPPTQDELVKGSKAIAIAQSLPGKTKREAAYIDAMAVFYAGADSIDHLTRCIRFEKAMEQLYKDYPSDKEAAIFYALALNGAADPTDKTFSKQKKAGAILTALYPGEPDHPGIIHYIIHSYDYPELAALALPAARKYASVAPSSAHAQHMPSHIFTRLGLWDECIASNLASTSSARCYAENTGIKGHWDEELHGLDYLVYAYLQKGDNTRAKQQCDYLHSITGVFPVNFKDAYAFAAIPVRYVLENREWKEATALQFHPSSFPWGKYPWQKAIIYFGRSLGYARTGQIDAASKELDSLSSMHDELLQQKDAYKANQVLVQWKAAQAWIWLAQGKKNEAIAMMTAATRLEEAMQKHPVTPCEVLPARELLADMLLLVNRNKEALAAYREDLQQHPKRFNGLHGAALAAERLGNNAAANMYYRQLIEIADTTGATREEIAGARMFLRKR